MSSYQLHRDPAAIEAAAARSLTRPDRDTRTGEEYAAALEAETDASLRRDPTRWRWRTLPETVVSRRTRELP